LNSIGGRRFCGPAATLIFVADMAGFDFILHFYLQGGVVDGKIAAQVFGDLV
jgi:hypothetical protein